MYRICLLLCLAFGLSFQTAAQCGVYFKESRRQVFSNSFSSSLFEDVDGDGLEDLFGYTYVAADNGSPSGFQVQYYPRLAANSFDTTARSTSIANTNEVFGVLGDVNADGKKDLIVTHATSPRTVVTYLNDGNGNFSTATPATTVGSNDRFWAAGDLNNDGRADIISAVYGASGDSTDVSYRLAQPDNTFGAPVAVYTFTGYLWSAKYVASNITYKLVYSYPMIVEDLNGDGAKDIAFARYSGTTSGDGGWRLIVLTNNGSLTFAPTNSSPLAFPTTRLRSYDLNNDGKKDFVSHPIGGFVKISINNGDNTFTNSSVNLPDRLNNNYEDFYNTKEFLVADFDNDGDKDLLFPGSKIYALLRNQGNQTFVPESFGPALAVDLVANLNSDGKGDMVSLVRPMIDGAFRTPDGSNWRYHFLYNAVSFRTNVCTRPGQTKQVDFNGDGNTDYVFWNPTTGNWRNISTNPTTNVQWGEGALGDVPVPQDYDGDGKTDYGIYRKSTGTWWVKQSSNGVNFAAQFGLAEDKPVAADYDGDGKADLAVFRPSNGDWYFFYSSTQTYGAVHFGISEDKPVPQDYDGDGKADVAVWRPSTGVWYRLNSADLSISIAQFGLSGDKPLPGDYDADGKANPAVYRGGVWYIMRNDFSAAIFNWGSTTDYPFFDDAIDAKVGVYRKVTTQIYTMTPEFYGYAYAVPTYSTPEEISVSSILPPD